MKTLICTALMVLFVIAATSCNAKAVGVGENSAAAPYAGSLFDQVSEKISTGYSYEMNPSQCGFAPDYDKGSRDAWYTYGDCTGDYGPIDSAAE